MSKGMEAWQVTRILSPMIKSIMNFKNYSQALLTHTSPFPNVLIIVLFSQIEVIMTLTKRVC